MFLAFVWGRAGAEREYEGDVNKAQVTDPYLVDKIKTHARQGRQAATIAGALLKKFQDGLSEQEIKEWLAIQAKSQSSLISKHLQTTFNKQLQYKKGKREQFKHNQACSITLSYTLL